MGVPGALPAPAPHSENFHRSGSNASSLAAGDRLNYSNVPEGPPTLLPDGSLTVLKANTLTTSSSTTSASEDSPERNPNPNRSGG